PDVRIQVAEHDGGAKTVAAPASPVSVRIAVAEAQPDGSHPTGSGVRDVRLFRNGSLVKIWHGDMALTDARAVVDATVPLVAGENKLTAYAFNRDNIKSEDDAVLVTRSVAHPRKGTLFLVVIGIDHYANPRFDLRYAVADANAFRDELQAQQ